MNKSELMAFVKSDSIKNFVKASEVKTVEDINRLNGEGYQIGYTFDEFCRRYPKIDAGKIVYNNGLNPTYYYDEDKLILFPLHILGKQELNINGGLENEYAKNLEYITECQSNADYISQLMILSDKMRMEMLDKIIQKDVCEDSYKLFKAFYQTSDYGCGELSEESLQKLVLSKTKEQKQETEDALSEFPDTITIYRGEGDKSTPLNETISWTTDINQANFFASRMIGKNAKIHIAQVDKKDVIEYFEYEHECIVLPQNVQYQNQIILHGTDFFESKIPYVLERYQKYRDIAEDWLDFDIDDNEHGRLHTYRVLMNSLLIAETREMTEIEKDILSIAAIFHDTKRSNNEEDTIHGKVSAEYYREFAESYPEIVPYVKTCEQLIEYHSLPDEYGRGALSNADMELYNVFKDADALDRVRFGITALDLNQLRCDESKSMTMVSNILLEAIKEPEQEPEQGMEMI